MARRYPVDDPPARRYPLPVSSGGGTTPAAFAASSYTFASRSSTADPNNVTSGIAGRVGDDTVVEFALDNSVASIPGAANIGGAYVEWVLKDGNGDPMTWGLDQLDLGQVWAWLLSHDGVMPVDTYMAVALTAGGVGTIGNSGIVAGLRYNAAGNEAFIHGNVGGGAGWGAVLAAGTFDPQSRGVIGDVLVNNSNNSAFRNVGPIGADGRRSAVAGSSPIAPSGNIMTDGPFTHAALVVGCLGVGAPVPTTIAVSLRSLLFDRPSIDTPDLAAAAFSGPTEIRRIMVLGDSNGVGTTADADFGGDAVQAGWTFRDAGVNTANWPVGVGPACGSCPYLVQESIDRGINSGSRWLVRRAAAGADTSFSAVAANLNGAIADAATLGGGDPDMIVVFFGANDSQSAAEALAFRRNADRIIRTLRYLYPNAWIVWVKERNTNAGAYPNAAEVQAWIDDLAVDLPGVVVADGVTPPADLFDDIHFSSGAAGGYFQIAERAFAAVGL